MFPSVLFHVLLLLFCLYYFRGQNPLLTTCPNLGDHLKVSRGKLSEKLLSDETFVLTAQRLCESYNGESFKINKLLGFDVIRLEYVSAPIPSQNRSQRSCYAMLRALILQVDKGISGLQAKISPLPTKVALQLSALEKEARELLPNLPEPETYAMNMNEAIKEAESGHFLGCALIASRIIAYILDEIPGKDTQQKIETLKDKGLIKEKGEIPSEEIIKADKKARNYFSHNITALPNSSEALELLAISVRLLKLFKSFNNKS